jgi:hypothetical protein
MENQTKPYDEVLANLEELKKSLDELDGMIAQAEADWRNHRLETILSKLEKLVDRWNAFLQNNGG